MNDANEIINRIETFLRQQTELYSDVNFDLIDSVPTATAETIPVSLADRVNAVSSPGPEDQVQISENLSDNTAITSIQPNNKDIMPLSNVSTLDELYELCLVTPELRTDLPDTRLVFGKGNPTADLMLIGEAPGAEEDKLGEPFVGRSGQLLTKILEAINITRDQIYIANILKHRPPENRNPLPEERKRSLPYLLKQIELINPKLILCLGKISAETLLGQSSTMKEMRGTFHIFSEKYELLVTYHPAALLRNPNWKRETWEDVQLLRKRYDELGCKP